MSWGWPPPSWASIPCTSAAGVRTFWRLWLSAWETTSFEYDEFIDTGEHVVVVQTQRNRGRTSGIELEWNSYTQVWTIQDSKVVRVEFFPTRGEALEAVGLRELGRPEHRSGRDHQP